MRLYESSFQEGSSMDIQANFAVGVSEFPVEGQDVSTQGDKSSTYLLQRRERRHERPDSGGCIPAQRSQP